MRLRPKRLQDAANDYSWRRDAELCSLDATTPISCSFEEFLENYIEELYHAGLSCRFAIETLDGKHIGNCGYFNIDEVQGQAEMGIMVGDKSFWNQGYGADAVLTLIDYMFSQTKLKRIYLKTLNWNIRAQKCFQKCGFVPCGQLTNRDHIFILMEIYSPVDRQGQTR